MFGCHSHLVFEGSIPTCTCFCSENAFVTLYIVRTHFTKSIAPVSIISLQRTMEYSPNFTLNCNSMGSPATTVTWSRDGTVLARGEQYEMTQILQDGTTATYENILIVNGTPSTLLGIYSCNIRNDIGTATRNITIRGELFV